MRVRTTRVNIKPVLLLVNNLVMVVVVMMMKIVVNMALFLLLMCKYTRHLNRLGRRLSLTLL